MAKLISGTSVYGNISIATFVSAVGNVTGNYILGNGACLTGVITSVANINSGNSNVTIVAANSNISVGVGGTANVAVFATTGEFITGLLSVSGNVISNNVMATNIVNVASHTGSVVSVSANVTGGNLLTGGQVSSTGNITGGNITANSMLTTSNGAGTNFKVGDDAWIGDINLGNTIGIRGVASAAAGYIVFGNADGNALGRTSTGPLTYTGIFSASGNINTGSNLISAGYVTATGNVDGGNLRTGGLISATSTITGTSHLGAVVSVTANVTGGNLTTAGAISATGNISSNAGLYSIAAVDTNKTVIYGDMGTNDQFRIQIGGNTNAGFVEFATADDASEPIYFRQYTGVFTTATRTLTLLDGSGNSLFPGMVSATSNVIGGNIRTAGLISATGNVTGNFFIGNGSQLTGITASASGYFISNGTSNIAIASANANAFVTIAGTANVAVFATTGAFITGVVSASGNVTGGNVLTAGLISSTGNAVFGNITSGGGTGGNITGANVISCTNIKTTANTVANLPAAATVGAGARAFVTDATSTTFAATAVGGASNAVPVWTDGTTWKIG